MKTVVSITPTDRERAFCKQQGPGNGDIGKFLNTIKTGQPPFYVQCVGGTHRGGVLGVACRVHTLGWPYERALVEYGRLGGDLKEDHVMLEAVRNYQP